MELRFFSLAELELRASLCWSFTFAVLELLYVTLGVATTKPGSLGERLACTSCLR